MLNESSNHTLELLMNEFAANRMDRVVTSKPLNMKLEIKS